MSWTGSKSWLKSHTVAEPDVELNRIEANSQSIVTDMSHVDYWSSLTFKADRIVSDDITVSEIQHIENNLFELHDVIGHSYTVEVFSAGVALDFTDFNRWENALLFLRVLATLLPQQLKYCGTYYCGEDGDIY